MKTTLVLPDDLYHEAKARAAAQRRTVKDLVADGLRGVLASRTGGEPVAESRESSRVLAALDDILRCPPSVPGRTDALQSTARKSRQEGWSRIDESL